VAKICLSNKSILNRDGQEKNGNRSIPIYAQKCAYRSPEPSEPYLAPNRRAYARFTHKLRDTRTMFSLIATRHRIQEQTSTR
jgi:hypothetical protein